jgi:hypothetical protein
MADYAARLGTNWDEGLHNGLASFETRPLGAPQHEGMLLMASGKMPHPEETAEAVVSKDARRRSSRLGFLAQPLR